MPDEMEVKFQQFMLDNYPDGSGNIKGAFYDDDMWQAFTAGYNAARGDQGDEAGG